MTMGQPENLGSFVGSFVVTTIFETIGRVLCRDHKTDMETIATIRDLRPLLDGLYYFKQIHNFMQNFVGHMSRDLYGDPKKRKLDTANRNKVRALQDDWEKEFGGDFGRDFRSLRKLIKKLSSSAKGCKIVNHDLAETFTELDPATRRAIEDIGDVAARTYSTTSELLKELEIERQTVKQLSDMGTDQLEEAGEKMKKWRKTSDLKATCALGSADHTLLCLIQILYFLYLQIPGIEKARGL